MIFIPNNHFPTRGIKKPYRPLSTFNKFRKINIKKNKVVNENHSILESVRTTESISPTLKASPAVIQNQQLKMISILGQGSFGVVYKMLDTRGRIVAVKRTKIDVEFQNRELEILQECDSPYINRLYFSFTENIPNENNYFLYLVVEYFPSSLETELQNYHTNLRTFNQDTIKGISYQIFSGLAYLHEKNIIHRDIKPANILLNLNKHHCALCDLGSAKSYDDDTTSVSYVGSRWYRAPELLLGSQKYRAPIDVWAAGCVIAEIMLNNAPLFMGNDNKDQIIQIIRLLGYPSEEDLESFDHTEALPKKIARISNLKQVLPIEINPDLLKILESIFVYDVNKRITAQEILDSPYFQDLNFETF